MDKETKEQVDLLNLNLLFTVIFVVSLIFSLIITYNEEMLLLKKKSFFNARKEQLYNFDNRILVTLLTLGYLYINIKSDLLARKKGQDPKNFDLQVLASIFSFISVIIVLYISYYEYQKKRTNEANVENPNL